MDDGRGRITYGCHAAGLLLLLDLSRCCNTFRVTVAG
jgi:hypothetical protein